MPRLRLPTLSHGRVRLYAVTLGVGLVAVTCAGLLIAVALAQEPPSWWRRVDRDDPQTKRCAADLENGVVSTLTEIRPAESPGAHTSAPWRFSVAAADANAWLNTRFKKWLENQSGAFDWPEEIDEIQVEFRDEQILLGVRLRSGESSQVLCATVVPRLRDGALYVPAESISLGRLPVPRSWFLSGSAPSVAQDQIPEPLRELPQVVALAAAFAGKGPVAQSPVIKLDGGRRVRLLEITPRDGSIELTCCTEYR